MVLPTVVESSEIIVVSSVIEAGSEDIFNEQTKPNQKTLKDTWFDVE